MSKKDKKILEPVKEFSTVREKIHEIIFEADTPMGKFFDIALFVFIIASVLTVMLETVPEYHDNYLGLFISLEWIFTIFFTIEYILRLYCVYKPMKYATSFYGIIDLLAIAPAYLSLIIGGTPALAIIRALRLLRVFRIFKLGNFISEGRVIVNALKASRAKISVFIVFVLLMVCIFGSIMYLVEGGQPNSKFDSIPRSVYWAIVTLTTVGYGDISPVTTFGQFLASIIMIMGYAVIAVPTGIVSAEAINEIQNENNRPVVNNTQVCQNCLSEDHSDDANYCYGCGSTLHRDQSKEI